ncbi:MAG: hypothetical protein CV087_22455 [Candidatus Brocadia sp. WS118]|nr:MAG: hypothetical protein CV087_22455 [Candidatus Brocadia sp. WS118]
MKGIDNCFDKLSNSLSPTSYYYDDIIHLKGRYNRLKREVNLDVVSSQDKNIEINKIEIALIEYINKFKEEDFQILEKKDDNEESSFNHFWKPFFDGRTTIVIGTYYGERFRAWEASTLMATGDAIALGTIMGTLNNVGVKNIDVVPVYNFSGDRYQDNLVLLGGPDANKLTREFYSKLDTKFKFGNPDKNEISLFDSYDKSTYFSHFNNKNQVTGDYGFAFKTINPLNPETSIIIIAGCLGFGTCAAAQLFESSRLLSAIKGYEGENGFEALVFSEIINDWTQKPKIIKSYKL